MLTRQKLVQIREEGKQNFFKRRSSSNLFENQIFPYNHTLCDAASDYYKELCDQEPLQPFWLTLWKSRNYFDSRSLANQSHLLKFFFLLSFFFFFFYVIHATHAFTRRIINGFVSLSLSLSHFFKETKSTFLRKGVWSAESNLKLGQGRTFLFSY